MAITYPPKKTISADHRVLLVSLGGASASSSPGSDHIATLASEIAKIWNPLHPSAEILPVTGGATPINSSNLIAEKLTRILNWMLSVSQKIPKLVLIGKSMGGCKLHKTVMQLAKDCVAVDLFIGVDMSCIPKRHYDSYIKNGRDAMVFPDKVKSLVNFIQTGPGEFQCGHVALWKGAPLCTLTGPRAMYRDYNINVNEDCVHIGSAGEVLFEGTETICESVVGHMEIDSDPRLLAALKAIVERRVLQLL